MDLALNNLQRLIYHKTQPTNQPSTEPNFNMNSLMIIHNNIHFTLLTNTSLIDIFVLLFKFFISKAILGFSFLYFIQRKTVKKANYMVHFHTLYLFNFYFIWINEQKLFTILVSFSSISSNVQQTLFFMWMQNFTLLDSNVFFSFVFSPPSWRKVEMFLQTK